MASSLEPLARAADRTLSSRELREKYNSYIRADPALVESRRWIEVSFLFLSAGWMICISVCRAFVNHFFINPYCPRCNLFALQEVTRREFKSDNFRESLADGILLCE